MSDSVLTWKHFAYTLDEENRITSWDDSQIVEEAYQALVIENDFIRLTLVPEFGGRIISFIYKPTGHEQLYQNPVGTPYGMNEGNFYYNWLMVWGGIFPTYSEPEHGKSWLLPWKYELLHSSPDSIILQMALKDTIDFSGRPGAFNNGATGITCLATIKVRKGQSSFDLQIALINEANTDKRYEYWTCNTWAPGSEPGNTYAPLNSEMIVPIDFYQARWSPGNWIVSSPVDEAADTGSDILHYENLALLENWKDMGIAYAYPEMTADFYGVINHENEEGIFRVGDNSITSGLKFWTWGAGAIDNDPTNFYDNKRSYIELWSGVSHEFFEDAILPANSSVSWTEHFFPTFDLENLTYANAHGYVYVAVDAAGMLQLKANTVYPGQPFDYTLRLNQEGNEQVLSESDLVSGELHNETVSIDPDEAGLVPGALEYEVILTGGAEKTLLAYKGELVIPGPEPLSVPESDYVPLAINKTGPFQYELRFEQNTQALITVFDLQGRIQFHTSTRERVIPFQVSSAGLYLVKVATKSKAEVVKFVVR